MRKLSLLLSASLAAGVMAGTQASALSLPSLPITGTVPEGVHAGFGADDFARSATSRPIPVVVHGGAAGLDHPQFSQAVVNNMQGEAWGSSPRYVAESGPGAALGENTNQEYTIVAVVNGPGETTGDQLCADPAMADGVAAMSQQPMTVQPRAHVTEALCHYNSAISSVDGYAGNIQGVNDPKFRQMIASTTLELTDPSVLHQQASFKDSDE